MLKRTLSTLLCLAAVACADEGDDETQVIANAAAAPLPFESNTLLELMPLDSASCVTESTALVPGFTVLQDAQSFHDAYLAARPNAAQVPSIDFANYVVVKSVLGQQGGCGARVELTSAINRSESVEIEVRTSNGDCTAPTDRISFAFAFAKVNRLAKPYTHQESDALECPSMP
ncbi:MAG TPA: hypothetical protein VFX59_15685 [Polyangiales bacterium]|nr:hypothetical protein [Polyangiales bacterium]